MGEMYALLAITLVAKYLPRAVKNGKDRQARSFVSLANTLAGYYMRCTSAHSLEHAMGGFHPKLPHGAGLIMLAHAYYAFFADRKACEGQMVKMAKAMGMPDARTGQDFIRALDSLLAQCGVSHLTMSDYGITKDELSRYTLRVEQKLLDKLGYIAEYEGRTKNRELEQMIKKCIRDFEQEHGEITLE